MSRFAGFDRSDVWRAVLALLASSVGLALAGWVLPGIAFDGAVAGRAGGPGHGRGGAGDPAGAGRRRHPARDGRRARPGPARAGAGGLRRPVGGAGGAGRLVPGRVLGDLDRRRRRDARLLGDDGRDQRRRLRPARAWRATGEARAGPGRHRHPLRAARRGALPGAPVGRDGRHPADAVAVDPQRQPRVHGVDPHAAGDDAGQPDGDPARDHRRHPGLPLGRPRHRAASSSPTSRPTRSTSRRCTPTGAGCSPTAGCR